MPPRQPDAVSRKIAEHLVRCFLEELAAGRLPREFLPLQSGVGNVGNALLAGLGENPDLPAFTLFTEVFQDSCVDLMRSGRLTGASSTALTLSEAKLQEIYHDLDYFGSRIVLRPQEISNSPTVIRQLGVIATNTAIEVDIYGHANSSHVCGTQMMNGIGGAGDFERNAGLSVFVCPSIAKGGRISTIVPFCSHVDHSEHSVHVVVTEQGMADLRGLGPTVGASVLPCWPGMGAGRGLGFPQQRPWFPAFEGSRRVCWFLGQPRPTLSEAATLARPALTESGLETTARLICSGPSIRIMKQE